MSGKNIRYKVLDNPGVAKDIREKIEVFLNLELDLVEEYEYHNISEFSLNITEDNRAAKINEFTLDMRLLLNHDECDYDCDDQGKIFFKCAYPHSHKNESSYTNDECRYRTVTVSKDFFGFLESFDESFDFETVESEE